MKDPDNMMLGEIRGAYCVVIKDECDSFSLGIRLALEDQRLRKLKKTNSKECQCSRIYGWHALNCPANGTYESHRQNLLAT